MPTREEAKALAEKLHHLGGGASVRRKAAARQIAKLEPTDATELINHLLILARKGSEPATCVLGYFVDALGMEAADIPYASSLKRLATIQDLEPVAALFAEGPAKKELHQDVAAKQDAKIFTESLGHMKTKARLTRDPDELSRLATASNPAVMRNVLINPRMTEALVVRIAARRPARPEPLIEIWRHPRWSVLHKVRRALAFNPYLPPEVGAKIVPMLSGADLIELARDTAVHPSLRAQAEVLLEAARAKPAEPDEKKKPPRD